MKLADPQKFWSRVDKDGHDGCWMWMTSIAGNGYGLFYLAGKKLLVHRVAYELLRGPIPSGLVIDHLCRNRACVNPDHLEPVTERENLLRGVSPMAEQARQTHCKRGHPLSGENLKIRTDGSRQCKQCARYRERRRQRTSVEAGEAGK
jgi:hypothetical protein